MRITLSPILIKTQIMDSSSIVHSVFPAGDAQFSGIGENSRETASPIMTNQIKEGVFTVLMTAILPVHCVLSAHLSNMLQPILHREYPVTRISRKMPRGISISD